MAAVTTATTGTTGTTATTATTVTPWVVDAFPYNGEPIVERRLRYLASSVDMFLVVEARYTHSGMRKSELYTDTQRHVFQPYADKVRFLIIDEFPPVAPEWAATARERMPWVKGNVSDWWRESFQRDAATAVLRDMHSAERPLLALVCDSDEIPSRGAIAALVDQYAAVASRPAVHLVMALHYYAWEWTSPEPWARAFAVAGAQLQGSLSAVRNQPPASVLPDAGWHCSYFMSASKIARKIQSFAHREFATDVLLNTSNIEGALARGEDVLGRHDAPLQRTTPAALAAVPPDLLSESKSSSSSAGGA